MKQTVHLNVYRALLKGDQVLLSLRQNTISYLLNSLTPIQNKSFSSEQGWNAC